MLYTSTPLQCCTWTDACAGTLLLLPQQPLVELLLLLWLLLLLRLLLLSCAHTREGSWCRHGVSVVLSWALAQCRRGLTAAWPCRSVPRRTAAGTRPDTAGTGSNLPSHHRYVFIIHRFTASNHHSQQCVLPQTATKSSLTKMAASRESIMGFVFIASPPITVIMQVTGTIDGTAPLLHQSFCFVNRAYSLFSPVHVNGSHFCWWSCYSSCFGLVWTDLNVFVRIHLCSYAHTLMLVTHSQESCTRNLYKFLKLTSNFDASSHYKKLTKQNGKQ